MPRLQSARVDALGQPRALTAAEIQEFYQCPTGGAHVWQFRRSPDGVGIYRCHCATTVEKRDLKRVTDSD